MHNSQQQDARRCGQSRVQVDPKRRGARQPRIDGGIRIADDVRRVSVGERPAVRERGRRAAVDQEVLHDRRECPAEHGPLRGVRAGDGAAEESDLHPPGIDRAQVPMMDEHVHVHRDRSHTDRRG